MRHHRVNARGRDVSSPRTTNLIVLASVIPDSDPHPLAQAYRGCMKVRSLVRRHGDVALAGAVATILAIEVTAWDRSELPGAVLTSIAAGLALVWRRNAALPSFLIATAASWATIRFAPGLDSESVGFLLIFFVSSLLTRALDAWVRGLGRRTVRARLHRRVRGRRCERPGHIRRAQRHRLRHPLRGTPWAAGLAIRLRREREESLVVESENAIARERARIARELHDVVSHAISVTVLQARGGRAMVGRDENAVRRALDAIEQTNTAALSDMRRLLAVLRDTDSDDEGRAAPQPSIVNLERLIEQVRQAGLPTELSIRGEPGPVPPGVDLSAYRIVQEALTNVMKHSGDKVTAIVTVTYTEDDLQVSVVDDGLGAAAPTGSGHGIAAFANGWAWSAARSSPSPGPAADSRSAPVCPTHWRP